MLSKSKAIKEMAEKIRNKKIMNRESLEREKISIAKKYSLDTVIKNADIISHGCESALLRTKPVRTLSGVSSIAVMWLSDKTCPGDCIYCPQSLVDKNVPKSYTGVEPATLRAMRNNFDPGLQTRNRLKQLHAIGHSTCKCELIIMGGTFLSSEKGFQENFVKKCFDALNDAESGTLEEAQRLNENAPNRCVGLTIETRADFCKSGHIRQMLRLGCTRVELGVQSTDDKLLKKIKRGHATEENIKSIRLLKEAGLKVCVHWMPGLTGLNGSIDAKKEIEMFSKLFERDYCPDELKIYPVLVIPGTGLHELWRKGEYEPLETGQAIQLLIEMKKFIPKYMRVKRIMRDISEKVVAAGPKTTNLRQLLHENMKKEGIICRCIRCREAGNKKTAGVSLQRFDYEASGGKEIFLSFEDAKNNLLVAFLRLRLGNDGIAKIRELHVYGEVADIGKEGKLQHHGYGRKLLEEAERIAKECSKEKIQITSGAGVRSYYRKLGYAFEQPYMCKGI